MIFLRRDENRIIFCLIFLCLLWFFCGSSAAEERIISRESPAPGCRFLRIVDTSRELAVYVFTADLHHPDVQIQTALAGSIIPGIATVKSIARKHENENYRIAGAVNGDFFIDSQPLGLMVRNGQLVKMGEDWSSIAFTRDKEPRIDVFSCRLNLHLSGSKTISLTGLNTIRRRGDIVLYTADFGGRTESAGPGQSYIVNPRGKKLPASGTVTVEIEKKCSVPQDNDIPEKRWILSFGENRAGLTSGLKPGDVCRIQVSLNPGGKDIYQAISGGPRLLRKGKLSVEHKEEGQRKGFDVERHPRTAVGFSRDRRILVLAVVDGRQPGYSLGMNLYELARFMLKQGCYEAMNLDGGGSSTMVVNGDVVNRPSDITGVRPVAGALLVGVRLSLPGIWN